MIHDTQDQSPSRSLDEASRASRRRLLTLLGAVPLTIGFTTFTAPEVTAKKRRKHKKKGNGNGKGNQPPPGLNTPPPAPDEQEILLGLINDLRSANALVPLARHNQLDSAAQAHSRDMAARHYSSHNSPEGVGPDARISAAGYTFDWWAENIYYGGGTAGEAFGWWANSTGHRANMLSANFDELGIGLAFDARDQVWRWTTVFASPVG